MDQVQSVSEGDVEMTDERPYEHSLEHHSVPNSTLHMEGQREHMALDPVFAEDHPNYLEIQRDVHNGYVVQEQSEEAEHATDEDHLNEEHIAEELCALIQDLDGQEHFPKESGKADPVILMPPTLPSHPLPTIPSPGTLTPPMTLALPVPSFAPPTVSTPMPLSPAPPALAPAHLMPSLPTPSLPTSPPSLSASAPSSPAPTPSPPAPTSSPLVPPIPAPPIPATPIPTPLSLVAPPAPAPPLPTSMPTPTPSVLPLPPSQTHDVSPHIIDGDPLQEVEWVFPKATDNKVGSQREPNPGDISDISPVEDANHNQIGNDWECEVSRKTSLISCDISLEFMCSNTSHNPT